MKGESEPVFQGPDGDGHPLTFGAPVHSLPSLWHPKLVLPRNVEESSDVINLGRSHGGLGVDVGKVHLILVAPVDMSLGAVNWGIDWSGGQINQYQVGRGDSDGGRKCINGRGQICGGSRWRDAIISH